MTSKGKATTDKKVAEKAKNMTIRQYMYSNKYYKEDIILSLERKHKESVKSSKEWNTLLHKKGFNF